MDMTGEQHIPAPREIVWKALNDPDVLRACIPGCKELDKRSDTEMTAVAVIKIGPISARFEGAVTLSDLDPPNGYRITGEGQGGVAGNARGSAVVTLADDGDGTLLTYDVDAQIGGKLAQLGGRMIDATARSLSAAFFKKFAQEIDERFGAPAPAHAAPEASETLAATSADAQPSAPTVAPPREPGRSTAGTPMQARSGPFAGVGAILLGGLVLLGVAWLLFARGAPGLQASPGQSVSPDFAAAVQLLTVLAIGYLLGLTRNGRA